MLCSPKVTILSGTATKINKLWAFYKVLKYENNNSEIKLPFQSNSSGCTTILWLMPQTW